VKEYRIGKFAGIQLNALPSTLIGFMILWIILGSLAYWLIGLSPTNAVLGGLLATALHFLSEFVHHLGHAVAARQTGYPMSGVRFGTMLFVATSLYPQDEPELPREIHIRRALGGPLGSFTLSIIAGVIALIMRQIGGVFWWVALFFFLDNFIVLTLCAFLPMGFTDGNTLLEWSKKR
jgi:Zn-dependent protease